MSRHSKVSSRRRGKARVIAASLCTACAVVVIAGTSAATSYRHVDVVIDGVTKPVGSWNPTVAGVMEEAGVEASSRHLVRVSRTPVESLRTETVPSGSTVEIVTAKPWTVQVGTDREQVIAPAESLEEVLTAAQESHPEASIAVSRASDGAKSLPVAKNGTVKVIHTSRTGVEEVALDIAGDETLRSLLAAANIDPGPLDEIHLTDNHGQLELQVVDVVRETTVSTAGNVLPVAEEPSDVLFEGESEVIALGQQGSSETREWVVMRGNEELVREVVFSGETGEAIPEVKQVGTKKVTPEALIEAGIDPKAELVTEVSPEGKTSIRYKAPLGSISSAAEIEQIKRGSGNGSTAPSLIPPGTYSGEDPRGIAQQLVDERGWSDQFSCLLTLWDRESHWNPYAENKSSGAYGIPQALPGSKMASAGEDWQTNPRTQIIWGLGYIAGRYGTPCQALDHSNSVGWY